MKKAWFVRTSVCTREAVWLSNGDQKVRVVKTVLFISESREGVPVQFG